MLESPRLNSTKAQQRLSRQLSAISSQRRKPTLQVLAGAIRNEATIVEANGFDILIKLLGSLQLRQRVVVMLSSEIAAMDIAIPGAVHWLNSRGTALEAAIVLQEPLPKELSVRPQECTRNGIRFACHQHGILTGLARRCQETERSAEMEAPATAINYSRDGFCVQLSVEPLVGAEVTFAWQSERSSHALHGIVRWVITQNSGATAGIELVDCKGYLLGGVDI